MPVVTRIPEPNMSALTSDANCLCFIFDAARNRYVGMRFPIHGIENYADYVVMKHAPDGTFLAAWKVDFDRKIVASSGASFTWVENKLVVGAITYGLSPAPRLPYRVEFAVLEDAEFNGAGLRAQEGGEGFVGSIPQGLQEVEVEIDYEAIAEAVIQRLKVEMGGELRQVLMDKAMDALGKAFDHDLYETNPRSKYVQDAAAPWFRDRAYEGAQAAEG